MNWKKLIADLAERRVTQKQIAAACGCGQASVSDIASGATKDPRASIALALLALAKKHRIKVEEAPKEAPEPHQPPVVA